MSRFLQCISISCLVSVLGAQSASACEDIFGEHEDWNHEWEEVLPTISQVPEYLVKLAQSLEHDEWETDLALDEHATALAQYLDRTEPTSLERLELISTLLEDGLIHCAVIFMFRLNIRYVDLKLADRGELLEGIRDYFETILESGKYPRGFRHMHLSRIQQQINLLIEHPSYVSRDNLPEGDKSLFEKLLQLGESNPPEGPIQKLVIARIRQLYPTL